MEMNFFPSSHIYIYYRSIFFAESSVSQKLLCSTCALIKFFFDTNHYIVVSVNSGKKNHKPTKKNEENQKRAKKISCKIKLFFSWIWTED